MRRHRTTFWPVVILAIVILGLLAAPVAAGIKPTALTVNGQIVELDTDPVMIDGRLFAPVQSFAKVLGARVEWNETQGTVEIRVTKREFFNVVRPDMAQYYSPPNVTLEETFSVPADPRIWEQALRQMTYPTDWTTFNYMVLILPYKVQKVSEVKSDAVAISYPNHSAVVFGQAADYAEGDIMGFALHEFGHDVWFSLMDARAIEEYRKVRSLEDEAKFNENGEYTRRPQEIFAEDFRILFAGSPSAKYLHMNKDLPAPEDVRGLREFMLGLAKH